MLHKTRMGDGEEFDMFKARVMQLAARLKTMGEAVSDGELIHVILQGLPSSFAGVRQALEVADDLTLEGMSNHLRDSQEKKKYMGRTSEEEDVACYGSAGRSARGGSGGGGGGRFGGGGRGGGGGRREIHRDVVDEEDGGGSDESNYRCRLCRKVGHWEQYCEKRRGGADACYRCGKSGHQMRHCKEQKVQQQDEAASFSVEFDEDYAW